MIAAVGRAANGTIRRVPVRAARHTELKHLRVDMGEEALIHWIRRTVLSDQTCSRDYAQPL